MGKTNFFRSIFFRGAYVLAFAAGFFACQSATAFDHGVFDSLLQKYVHGDRVDYEGLRSNLPLLDSYLGRLATVQLGGLSRSEQLALYINAYNAFTMRLVVRHFGKIKSIRDLTSAWKTKEWVLAGEKVSLDDIENVYLRGKFKEPRIHFAIVCASNGCPNLYPRAFSGQNIETELSDATRQFMASEKHVRKDGQILYLSKIFEWFKGDFVVSGKENLVEFLKKYGPSTLRNDLGESESGLKVRFLDYDWKLNAIRGEKH